MQEMSPDEYKSFLLNEARTAKLATVRRDGRPHVAPVWFDLDGDDLVFTTWHESVKAANIGRDPRVSLCVDEETPPFAFVLVEGMARAEADAPDLLYWATRIAGRYMGADRAEEYGRRNGVPGELLVRVTPTKVVARKNVSD
jgi:PPOX class probable F420-dependent enzyme